MNIDWSKAPAWASAVGTVSGGSPAWISDEGYCFHGIANPPCHPYKGEDYTRDSFTIVARRPWTGEGLPPVGTVCLLAGETLTLKPIHPDWAGAEVKVYAHFETDQGRKLAAYVSEDHMKGGVGVAELFRPKLTAEQIAAQQREALELEACTEIEPKLDGYNVDLDCSTAIRMTIHAMIEAGYRKQVQL